MRYNYDAYDAYGDSGANDEGYDAYGRNVADERAYDACKQYRAYLREQQAAAERAARGER